jgi:hypothetical protein
MSSCLTVGRRAQRVHLHMVRGHAFGPVTITLTGPDGTTPINLTGASLYAQVRRKASDEDAVATFVVTVTNASGGIASMSMTEAEAENIPAVDDHTAPGSQSVWDVVLVDSLGRPTVLAGGPLTGHLSVTDLP